MGKAPPAPLPAPLPARSSPGSAAAPAGTGTGPGTGTGIGLGLGLGLGVAPSPPSPAGCPHTPRPGAARGACFISPLLKGFSGSAPSPLASSAVVLMFLGSGKSSPAESPSCCGRRGAARQILARRGARKGLVFGLNEVKAGRRERGHRGGKGQNKSEFAEQEGRLGLGRAGGSGAQKEGGWAEPGVAPKAVWGLLRHPGAGSGTPRGSGRGADTGSSPFPCRWMGSSSRSGGCELAPEDLGRAGRSVVGCSIGVTSASPIPAWPGDNPRPPGPHAWGFALRGSCRSSLSPGRRPNGAAARARIHRCHPAV